MQLFFFITSLGGGGAERVVCNLANYLVKRAHQVNIIVLRGNDKTYELAKEVVLKYLQPEYYKENKRRLYRFNEISATISFLKHLPKDALLISLLELPIAYSLIFRPFYKQKLIICERNNPDFYPYYYQKIFQYLSHKANGCICQTKTILNWYIPYLTSETKSKVIPNAINNDILCAQVSKREYNIIMTMGRLEPQKNQKMLLVAIPEVIKQYPDVKFNIYGKGPLEYELQDLIIRLGIKDNVELKGFTTDTISVFKESSIFILTSDHEGMPNVLAEAMAMGLPCISTDCGGGGAKDLIQNGVNGVLISRKDTDGLVLAIKSMLSDDSYATSLAMQAIKIRDRLAPDVIHKQWEEFFKQIYF